MNKWNERACVAWMGGRELHEECGFMGKSKPFLVHRCINVKEFGPCRTLFYYQENTYLHASCSHKLVQVISSIFIVKPI